MKELKEVIRDIGEILDSAEMYAKEAVKLYARTISLRRSERI